MEHGFYDFPDIWEILGIVTPTDELHHFSEGYSTTTNQVSSEGSSGNPGLSSNISAAVSLSGTMWPFLVASPRNKVLRDTPWFNVHSKADNVVYPFLAAPWHNLAGEPRRHDFLSTKASNLSCANMYEYRFEMIWIDLGLLPCNPTRKLKDDIYPGQGDDPCVPLSQRSSRPGKSLGLGVWSRACSMELQCAPLDRSSPNISQTIMVQLGKM